MPNHSSLYYNTAFNSLALPAIRTAAANSASMDLQNSDDATILFHIGAPGDTWSGSVKLCLEVQESADNSTWTACADASLTSVTSGNANAVNTGTVAALIANGSGSQIYQTGYIGTQRYVRGVLNYVGTHTTGTPTSVIGLTGRNRSLPVNP